ncbi:putative aldouronate transport system permease protein [Kribbella amoyensis]|uniref:Putative aldouronate transport system permease protein n=1 Tax=Kribbella amoyensis TaxID=996641 RepID=A0A561BXG2_9ACTN|nr:ABC transporter permease subunit [Kribbella amoyensis]TWD83528.1 putative aldouronate transport system permease protein [Kribbella amoyensis]
MAVTAPVDVDASTRPRTTTGRGRLTRLVRDRTLLLMMLPGLVFFLLFEGAALLGNVVIFLDYVPFLGFSGSRWVGLDNAVELFADPSFWQALVNTVALALLQLIFFFPLPVALALLLHSITRDWIRKSVQSIVYLPHFVSWVIVVAMFQQVLGGAGLLNGVLADNGLHTVSIFSDPALFRPLMVAELIWKDCGWGTIIVLAALHNVDDQLYEAAAMDGASAARRLWHVTLPALRPILILLLILRLGDILNVGFEQVLLQRDSFSPRVAEVLDTFTYYHGVIGGNWGGAALAGVIKGLIGLALVIVANRIAHRLGEEGVYR